MISTFVAIPGTCEAERERLLSFVVVGGGPTSCEFVAELHDFVTSDAKRLFPDMVKHVKVTLVEAGSLTHSSPCLDASEKKVGWKEYSYVFV